MIYFLQGEAGGNIKIGWTEGQVVERKADLETGSSVPLRVIGTMPGGREFESELHRRFAAAHVHKEWFRPTADLLAFIGVREADRLSPPVEIRHVAVKVMTLNGRQVTQTFFRQIAEQHIVDWEGVFYWIKEEGGHEGKIPDNLFFAEGSVPWGRVRYDCDGADDFQLVWQLRDELRRCHVARLLPPALLGDFIDPRKTDPLTQRVTALFRCVGLLAYQRLSRLDQLFIGV